MEYVYKLNLPALDDVLIPGCYKILMSRNGMTDKNNTQYIYSARNFLKPSWRKFNGLDWNTLILFYKGDYKGGIHKDSQDMLLKGAINWIISGHSLMEFWEEEDIRQNQILVNDQFENDITLYDTNVRPSKKYILKVGAYLINASVPHRATGIGKRFSASLRSEQTGNFTWKELVDKFQNYIETN
jgi:hypothetical protein